MRWRAAFGSCACRAIPTAPAAVTGRCSKATPISRGPAPRPDSVVRALPGQQAPLAFLRRLECGELCGSRLGLVRCLPLRERFAVDALARGVAVDLDAALERGLAVPVGEAVAAKACTDHQVDVLHVVAQAQV